MALGLRERGHHLGLAAPGVLLRRARCLRGEVELRVEFVPRPEFGLVHPRLVKAPGAIVRWRRGRELRAEPQART